MQIVEDYGAAMLSLNGHVKEIKSLKFQTDGANRTHKLLIYWINSSNKECVKITFEHEDNTFS